MRTYEQDLLKTKIIPFLQQRGLDLEVKSNTQYVIVKDGFEVLKVRSVKDLTGLIRLLSNGH